jgi:hypothetical protein
LFEPAAFQSWNVPALNPGKNERTWDSAWHRLSAPFCQALRNRDGRIQHNSRCRFH